MMRVMFAGAAAQECMEKISPPEERLGSPQAVPQQNAPSPVGSVKGQRVRMLRHMMAALCSVTMVSLVYLYVVIGVVPLWVANVYAAATGLALLAFSVCFAMGFNRRFADPSLTAAQMVAAGLPPAFLAFVCPEFRVLQLPIYMCAMMFGAFRLDMRRLAFLGAFFVLTYGGAMALSPAVLPTSGVPGKGALVAHLSILMAVMAWIGGDINSMRTRMEAANVDLKQALQHIERIAKYDELTGIYNRRTFNEIADKEKKRCDRNGASLCVALLDADHFKRVNDRFGHAVGDEVLRMLGRTLQSALRATDRAGRYGGEEFVVLMSEATQELATVPLERLRERIGSTVVQGLPEDERVTVSIGAATYRQGEDVADTIKRADEALYKAKRSGRNRIAWQAG